MTTEARGASVLRASETTVVTISMLRAGVDINSVVTPSTAVPPHRSRVDLKRQSQGLDDAVHRLILGSDDLPNKLSTQETTQRLGDRFAHLVLLEGVFPRNAGEVLDAIEQTVPLGGPLRVQQFFLAGESTQIAPMPSVAGNRNFRFLATVGKGPGDRHHAQRFPS